MKTLFLSLFIISFLSGCTAMTNNDKNYVDTQLTTKQTNVIANDIAKQLIAAYPAKNIMYQISSIQPFGRELAKLLTTKGYSVDSSIFSIKDENSKVAILRLRYNVDSLGRQRIYASVVINNSFRLTRQYTRKGSEIIILAGMSRGQNYE